jgi:hypothetical protein
MADWEYLSADDYRSPQFDELHARLENYQIYSLVWCDQTVRTMATELVPGVNLPADSGYKYADNSSQLIFVPNISIYNRPPTRTVSYSSAETQEATQCVAYQSFSPEGLIPFDFADLVRSHPEHALNYRQFYSRGDFFSFGYAPITHRWGDIFGRQKSDYRSLIYGDSNDSRAIPQQVTCIATTTRKIKLGYYRRNHLEAHPRLIASLDWVTVEKEVEAGKLYVLRLPHCVLGAVYSYDQLTKGEIVNGTVGTNCYPSKYLFPDDLADLFIIWDIFYPPSPPPTPRPLGLYLGVGSLDWVIPDADTYSETNWAYFAGGAESETVRLILESVNTPLVRVMAGNNDRWGHGSISVTQHYPPPTHELFRFDHQGLFDTLQIDGSYGTYMTDSPRILEIWQALEANKYATDPATNQPRVANLGHLLEKVANFIGYRPEPNGTIDESKESSTYARKEIDPKKPFPTGEYLAGRFGTKGMLMKRLPNKATATGWAPGGMVAVHDIPQMVAEMFDQTNTALNLQESTSIQIRDGGDLYKYPNQLSLLMEIATGQIQQRRQVREIWASSVVTQNTVNEVIGGLGLPTVSKSISINNQLIPYWGIQPSASLQREIATVGQNVGNVQGQIL